jgi:hypothetical protein
MLPPIGFVGSPKKESGFDWSCFVTTTLLGEQPVNNVLAMKVNRDGSIRKGRETYVIMLWVDGWEYALVFLRL